MIRKFGLKAPIGCEEVPIMRSGKQAEVHQFDYHTSAAYARFASRGGRRAQQSTVNLRLVGDGQRTR